MSDFRRDEYLNDIDDIINDAIDACGVKTQEQFEENRTEVIDHITESIGSSCWLIYTGRSLALLQFTNNRDAYTDHGVELNTDNGFDDIVSQVAYYAMYEDTMGTIDSIVEELPVDNDELEAQEKWDKDNILNKE